MGIIQSIRTRTQGIRDKARNAGVKTLQKAGDAVATVSQFSPAQVKQVDSMQEKYLTQIPSTDDAGAIELIERNLGRIGIEVYQEYLPLLSQCYVAGDVNASLKGGFNTYNRIKYFDITRWVLDIEENYIDKLVNVYHVLSGEDCSVALIYNRTRESCTVELAVANNGPNDSSVTRAYEERLIDAVRGNFPGVELRTSGKEHGQFGMGTPSCLQDHNNKSVAVVSNLAAEKSEKFISQSMEKLLDGIVPENEDEEYTIVLLASPVHDQAGRKNQLFQIASELTPYATWQTSYSLNELAAISSGTTAGIGAGVSIGNQNGITQGNAATEGTTATETEGTTDTEGRFSSTGETAGISGGGGIKAKVPFVAEGSLHAEAHASITHTSGKSKAHAVQRGTSIAKQVGRTVSNATNVAKSVGANFGINFARSSNVSMQIGLNKGITQTNANYTVQHTLHIIDAQIKRLEQCSALGMWDFAAYFISKSHVITNNTAHMYMALTQGEDSYMTRGAVNMWHSSNDRESAQRIIDSISKLQHPMFLLRDDLPMEDGWYMFPTLVNAATALSGRELAYALNIPRKSVSGLPVIESVSFGREVHRLTAGGSDAASIRIGSVYHLRHDENKAIQLDVDSFCSHTFVTGSTGSGKSNTVYLLLDQFRKLGKNFLVIEPAKGEYKNVFGGYQDEVKVFGTNPLMTPLLQVNPFSFPGTIHVLEHIDRLIEIFNACWPMYAAMPAVLKDAVEQCYLEKGWDLNLSSCIPLAFPTMQDLLEILPRVMEESRYSADTKNDYIGALYTRVKSLTNGINGQILSSRDTAEEESHTLFDSNVIVDLSRVGSAETKSLLMGILIMKLQEYRMHCGGMNEPLKHITVLEEAHNLLRRTSGVQTQESSNLQGKSVEMISNAIAEMRTYGEGFIIVDQAPQLLDESVIRNTNTKIVLRLPDAADRELVGKSEALNDHQIRELAKLPQGVAAVYQNDWIESVLCHFPAFPRDAVRPFTGNSSDQTPNAIGKLFTSVFHLSEQPELTNEEVELIRKWIHLSRFSDYTCGLLNKHLSGESLTDEEVQNLAYNVFDGSRISVLLENTTDEGEGIRLARRAINSMYSLNNEMVSNAALSLMMDVVFRLLENSNLEKRYRNIEFGRGVV